MPDINLHSKGMLIHNLITKGLREGNMVLTFVILPFHSLTATAVPGTDILKTALHASVTKAS